MRILIVGSNSVLARATGEALKKENTVLYGGRRNADYYLDLQVNDFSALTNTSFDVILHFASDFGGESYEDIMRCTQVNVLGTLGVCHLAEKLGAKQLIIISSVSALYKHTSPFFSAYSLSKKQADELALLYTTQINIPLAILRPSQVYDTQGRCQPHQPLFYHILKKASIGEDIIFYGKNNALRNYIHLDDFVECVLRTIPLRLTGVYCCTHPKSVRLATIAKIAFNIFNTKGNIIFNSSKDNIPDLPSFSGADFYKKIGYSPQLSLKAGITSIKNYQEQSCLKF